MSKVALVTGAAGGIGMAIAQRLGADGYRLALADLDESALNQMQQQLIAAGIEAQAFPGDLMDGQYCDALPTRVQQVMGSLDALCNNAGIITRGSVTESSDVDFARSMTINVEAPFRLCRSAIPIMEKQRQGAIVNTASCWGLYPGPNHAIYCASKSALATLTQCMGRDHAHQGIRINAVCPNEVNTPMLRSGFERRGFDSAQAIDQLNQTVPLGRIAEPEDIADVVAFLLGDQARYLCGATLEVNGGKAVQ